MKQSRLPYLRTGDGRPQTHWNNTGLVTLKIRVHMCVCSIVTFTDIWVRKNALVELTRRIEVSHHNAPMDTYDGDRVGFCESHA